jgi:hypothetical protein
MADQDSSSIGRRTEGIVLGALMRAGKKVLLPFGDGHRYDLALDEGGTLVRVQCKTARYRDGRIVFNTRSMRRDNSSHYYAGDADFFGVYAPYTDKVYLIPVGDVRSEGNLRVEPTKNNQQTGVRLAQQYEI